MPLLSPNPNSLIYTRISNMDPDQLGTLIMATTTSMPATATYTANQARYCPIVIHRPCTAFRFWFRTSGVQTGNYDVGIYDENGTRLVSSGSTALPTTQNAVMVDIADTPLVAGRYYLAHAVSSATSSQAVGLASIVNMRAYGNVTQASALPLPATMTFGTSGESSSPIMGIDVRGF